MWGGTKIRKEGKSLFLETFKYLQKNGNNVENLRTGCISGTSGAIELVRSAQTIIRMKSIDSDGFLHVSCSVSDEAKENEKHHTN